MGGAQQITWSNLPVLKPLGDRELAGDKKLPAAAIKKPHHSYN